MTMLHKDFYGTVSALSARIHWSLNDHTGENTACAHGRIARTGSRKSVFSENIETCGYRNAL